jgi:PAS domain-containing protein
MRVPLQRVIDSLDDGVVVADLEGRCLLSNPAARRIFSTDFADMPAAEWNSVFGCLLPDMVTPYPPQDMPLTRVLRGEVVSNLELFMVNLWAPQGTWLSVNGTSIRDAGGNIEGGVVVLRDITRIKRKIQQIELLSNVVEATADAVIVTDRGGRIEYVNPAFETATGYSRAEVLGRDPSILRSGAHPRPPDGRRPRPAARPRRRCSVLSGRSRRFDRPWAHRHRVPSLSTSRPRETSRRSDCRSFPRGSRR